MPLRPPCGGAPLLGQRLEQVAELTADDLPDLMRGRPTEDRVVRLPDGRALFGHAIAPQTARIPRGQALLPGGIAATRRRFSLSRRPSSPQPLRGRHVTTGGNDMLDSTVANRAQAVLDELGAALDAGEIDRAAALFVTDCYWRDLVSLTWNLRTMEGPDEVARMLRAQLAHIQPSGWRLDEAEIPGEKDGVITAWFRFETRAGRGYGLVRLRDGRIWTLLTALQELKGHEEAKGFTPPPRRAPRRRQEPPHLARGTRGRGARTGP